MSLITHILSDLDGTLIDSKASVVAAFRWWAHLRGLANDTADRIPHGRTSTDAASVLAPHLDAVTEGAVLDERQRLDTAGVVALPGAAELLTGALPVAIVTSCPLPLARARLAAARLPDPDLLITPEGYDRGKPDPEPYLVAARRLGAAASCCLVLEDAPSGVQAGRAAGMTVVGVLTTHEREELAEADAIVESVRDLRSILDVLRETPDRSLRG